VSFIATGAAITILERSSYIIVGVYDFFDILIFLAIKEEASCKPHYSDFKNKYHR